MMGDKITICLTRKEVVQTLNYYVKQIEGYRKNGSCRGPRNGLTCDLSILNGHDNLRNISNALYRKNERYRNKTKGKMLIKPTPWLTAGNLEWYGNDFLDYNIFRTFFSRTYKSTGIFLETGAGNGVHASNTLFFEHYLNWTGMLIEPTLCGKCQLPYNRHHSINWYGGICRNYTTMSTSFMKRFCQPPYDFCAPLEPTVSCRPIDWYVRQSGFGHIDIDFMSVDVEEFYFDVLKSWDWSRSKPRVILIECPKTQCTKYLMEKGYHVVSASQTDLVAWLNDVSCPPQR